MYSIKAQGLSQREISRRLGISRNTVSRYLASSETPRYKLPEARPTKLEPFHAYTRQFLCAAVQLTKAVRADVGVETANAEVGKWLRDVANQRIHPVTHRAPVVLFEELERAALLPLPAFARAQQPLPSLGQRMLLDRILHHFHIVQIKGDSYRLKRQRKAGHFLVTET